MSFKSVAADFVKAAKVFKSAILKVAGEAPIVIAKIEADAPEVEQLTELVYPGAVAVEAAAFSVFEKVADAVEAAGPAANSNGLSVSLDQEVIAAVEAVIPALKAFLATKK